MAGIKREQIDLASFGEIFATKEFVKDNASKETIIENIGKLSKKDLDELGLTERFETYINQSEKVKQIDSSINVTESDGKTYNISPTRGYVKKDGEDILVYQHPLKHNANEITETTDKKFASSSEKSTWNLKVSKEELNSSVESSKAEVVNLLLGYIETLTNRIQAIEEKMAVDTVEIAKKELVTSLNLVLNGICSHFTIKRKNDGVASYVVNHNLNTKNLHVMVYNKSTGEVVYPTIVANDYNNVQINFKEEIASGVEYTVVIAGGKEFNSLYTDVNTAMNNLCTRCIITGDGSKKSFTVNHNKGTKELLINILNSNNEVCSANVTYVDNNNINVVFNSAPAKGTIYNVIVTSNPRVVNKTGNEVVERLIGSEATGNQNLNNVLDAMVTTFTTSIAANATSATIKHNKGTLYPIITIYDADEKSYSNLPNITIVDANTIKLDISAQSTAKNFEVILLTSGTIEYVEPVVESEEEA